MFNNQILAGAAGQGGFYPYSIDQSLRFNAADSAYLSRTPSSTSNQKTWTFNTWIKLGNMPVASGSLRTGSIFSAGSGVYNKRVDVQFYVTDGFYIIIDQRLDGGSYYILESTDSFRDMSGWYMFTIIVDTTESTAADRIRMYVNGTRLTNLSNTNGYPAQNSNLYMNTSGLAHYIGETHHDSADYRLDAYLAEVNFVDGTAAEPSNFGETINGIWVPKEYSGSYGTNGFYLSFADSSAIGDDLSGNTNDWTANNLAASDVVPDSPTNNFATWNVAGVQYGGTNAPTVSEGSLKAATSGNPTHIYSTFAIQPTDTQGYYWEVKATSLDSARSYMGIVAPEGGASGASIGSYQFRYKFVLNMNDDFYGDDNSAGGGTVNLTSWTTNDILMFAYKNGKFWIGKNGTWMNSGDPAAGTGDLVAADGGRPSDRGDVTWYPYAGFNSTYTANFGQEGTFAGTETAGGNSDENGHGDFKYSVPSGFLALCSSNLPEATIGPNSAEQADDNFNTVLYTGTGSSNSITVGFQPDFTWIKSRNATYDHQLVDSVRGYSNSVMHSNLNVAEYTAVPRVDSQDANGFTVNAPAQVNNSGTTFAAWNWKAGGTAVSNTDGSITSSVSVNQDAGTSIVAYTGNDIDGATVGHGLSETVEAVIVKRRDSTGSWQYLHKNLSSGKVLLLNTTSAEASYSGFTGGGIDNLASTTFSLEDGSSNGDNVNASGGTYIAYCFHSVDGFSKVGKYVGNANANGTFVYTGFRPAFVILKASTVALNWLMYDNARNEYNVIDNTLYPNLTNAEATGTASIDFLSNGFKIRNSGNYINQSGQTFIYLAFAEAPFKYANAR